MLSFVNKLIRIFAWCVLCGFLLAIIFPINVGFLGLILFILFAGNRIFASLISERITCSAGSILFPQSQSREINLIFGIPEARTIEGKYEEALSLYKDMTVKDPKRLKVYLRIMNLAIEKMKQPEIARDAFRAGLENIKDADDRKILVREYKRLITYV